MVARPPEVALRISRPAVEAGLEGWGAQADQVDRAARPDWMLDLMVEVQMAWRAQAALVEWARAGLVV